MNRSPDFAHQHAAEIETLRVLGIKTGNPIYVWEAIALMIAWEVPLPDWALMEIARAALSIAGLAKHCCSADADGWTVSHLPAGKIEPSDAREMLPHALGLVRGRVNNFGQYASDHLKVEDAQLDFAHKVAREH